MKKNKCLCDLLLLIWASCATFAQTPLPLHVEGPFLVNSEGRRVNMHGFAQTFSPWFNEQGTKWTNYDVNKCLNYNKGIINDILKAGWKMNFVRQHMDPYWSNIPGQKTTGESDISAFSFERFKTYMDAVFVPMAEYAISKGLYVVMRPPGVCPEYISVGGEYHQYLKKIWTYVGQHPKLKNNGSVLFELANEPVNIKGTRERDIEMTQFMQELVDVLRQHCNNILLIPGLGWQSQYNGFVKYPIQGENIGYAVHCYPGWYNSGVEDDVSVEYSSFKRGWDENILPIATKAPVVVTEMDWAPKKYNASWGKATTGVAGGQGFGANFMRLCDETCNVSWLLFTDGHLLAQYDDTKPDGMTILTDPEACLRPVFRKYQYYATQEYQDIINEPGHVPSIKEQPLFSLTSEWLDPSIWEKGSFEENTGKLVTGKYGFGGWRYSNGVDLSTYHYLVVELSQPQQAGASFRLFDTDNYWSSPFRASFGNGTKLVIDLHNMKAYKDDACTQYDHDIDASHIYIAGFWSYGNSPIYIKNIFVSENGIEEVGISETFATSDSMGSNNQKTVAYFTPDGRRLTVPQQGLNIVKVTKTDGKTKTFKMCYNR